MRNKIFFLFVVEIFTLGEERRSYAVCVYSSYKLVTLQTPNLPQRTYLRTLPGVCASVVVILINFNFMEGSKLYHRKNFGK